MTDTAPDSRTSTSDAPPPATVRCSRCDQSFPAGTAKCTTCGRLLPGNKAAFKHGATAKRNGIGIFTDEERAEAEKDVEAILEELDVPTSVTALFYVDFLTEQHLIITALQRYFSEHGYLTSRGRPRASLQVMQQAQERFNRFVLRLEDLAADHARRNPERYDP